MSGGEMKNSHAHQSDTESAERGLRPIGKALPLLERRSEIKNKAREKMAQHASYRSHAEAGQHPPGSAERLRFHLQRPVLAQDCSLDRCRDDHSDQNTA